jgi:hypothetical protein
MHGPLNVKIRQQSVMHISTCKAFKDKGLSAAGLMQLMRHKIVIFCSKSETRNAHILVRCEVTQSVKRC